MQYGNVAAGPLAAVGARISSSSIGPTNATALTLEAIAGGAAWLLGGNATTSAQNIGTTSNFGMTFITNSVAHLSITSAGAITQAASAGQVTFTGNVDAYKNLAVAGAARYTPQAASAITGSTGGTITTTATFVKQSVGLP